MDNNVRSILTHQIDKVQSALKARQFECLVAEDREDALRIVTGMIPAGASVGLGGSMTLEETGILAKLYAMDIRLQDRYAEGLTREQRTDVQRAAFTADYYLTSTNALTLSGELLNIDGNGNRVAAMCFGPKKVIVVAGWNKIVMDEEAGWQRIRMTAAPANCTRLKKKTPCVQQGYCLNCAGPDRICAAYVKLERSNIPGRICVVIVKEDLGY